MALVIFGPRKWVPVVMYPRGRCWEGGRHRLTMYYCNLSKSFFAKLNHVENARKITKYERIKFTFVYSSLIICLTTTVAAGPDRLIKYNALSQLFIIV